MALSVQQWMQRGVLGLSGLLLLLLSMVFAWTGYAHLRADGVREITTLTQMIEAPLLQQIKNGKGMAAVLKTLQAHPDIELACVHNAQGTLLASWHRGEAEESAAFCQALTQQDDGGWRRVRVEVPLQAADDKIPVARVTILAGFPSFFSHFRLSVLAILAAMALFVAISFLFAQRMKVLLLRPVRQIANTAQRVSLYKDFSLRVTPGPLVAVPSEIQALIDSFNTMLREIEDRDGKILRKTVEIEKARHQAEAANIAKSQFLANISHELRTPLNAILGFSAMIKDQQHGQVTEPKYLEYAHDIHDSGQHLLTIINDVLDLSRAEAGKLSIHYELVALPKIIQKAVHMVAQRASEGGVTITTDMAEKIPKLVADRVRMLQILLNLLSNAVKFTDPGGRVTVRVRAEEGVGGVYYFLIDVTDTGVGMTPEEVNKAFHSFTQGDAGLDRKYQGAGLGLPLTRKLVELHHGKITLKSERGKGTTAHIRLVSDPALLD